MSSDSEAGDESHHGTIPFQELLEIAGNMANDPKHGTKQDIETVLRRTFAALTGNYCHHNGSIAITFTGEECASTTMVDNTSGQPTAQKAKGRERSNSEKSAANRDKKKEPKQPKKKKKVKSSSPTSSRIAVSQIIENTFGNNQKSPTKSQNTKKKSQSPKAVFFREKQLK